MGSRADERLRARQTATARRAAQLVERRPGSGSVAPRVLETRRLVRTVKRRLRACDAAAAQVHASEAAVGAALADLVRSGVPLVDAALLVGVSRSAARRMVELARAAEPATSRGASTAPAAGVARGLGADEFGEARVEAVATIQGGYR